MTDDSTAPSPPGDLGPRLRAGIDTLAREAGSPPPLATCIDSTPSRAARGSRRVLLAAGVAVVVAVIATGLVLTADSDPRQQVTSDEPTTAPASTSPLFDTRWWLVSATDQGAEVPIETTGTPYLELRFLAGAPCAGEDIGCYDGPQVVGSDACNGVSRKITVDGDTVALGESFGIHTAMACFAPLPTLLQAFFAAGAVTYSIDGDELRLVSGSGEVVLTYQAIDTPFGPTSSRIVDDGVLGAQAYRLVWDASGGLELQVVDATTAAGQPGSAGVGADPGRVNAMRSEVAGQAYLFGIVPAAAARVVYEPDGGDPQDLEIIDVGDPGSALVGQLVDADPPTWAVVAYDEAGEEIHRLRWG